MGDEKKSGLGERAELVWTIRERLKMSFDDIAKALGVSYFTVYSWATGRRPVPDLAYLALGMLVKRALKDGKKDIGITHDEVRKLAKKLKKSKAA